MERNRQRRTHRRLQMESLEARHLLSGDGLPAINLALFQTTTADSSDGGTNPSEATDGIVSNDSRWYSDTSGPHWLEVELAEAYPVGSVQLFLGKDDSFTVGSFQVQYHNGSSWQTAINVTGNTATDLNLALPSVIDDATRFRFYTTEGVARIKEFVLLPPTDDGSLHPLGTGVNLNLASQRAPIASSNNGANDAVNAVDGYVDDGSRWLSNGSGGTNHTIEFTIPTTHAVGSLHLYSGFDSNGQTSGVLSNFSVEYANGSGWLPIAGGTVSSGSINGNSVTGNTSDVLVIDFATPVDANKVRLSFTGGFGRVRELVVLPENVTEGGGSGYEIGTSVVVAAPPSTEYATYGDAWHRIAARSNDNSLIADTVGASQADGSTPDEEKFFQLLYSYALDAYRIRNQETGHTLEVAGASRDAGAAIVEGPYEAAPHQLWRLEPTSNGYFQIVNVWSGMVLQTDGGSPAVVTQQPRELSNPTSAQQWIPRFQDDYFKKGTGGWVGQYGTGWAYNWNRSGGENLGPDQFFAPMQHREGWPNLTTLHTKRSDWHDNSKASVLLGFNEPDRPDQANMGVTRAIELWPQLEALDVPLISPAPALGGEDWWLNDFMDQADNRSLRVDYAGGHWYAGPSVDNLFAHIDDLQAKGNGRDVWLTEFSVVDWSGGSGNWSEESNYNFILEFLWRAEAKNNLDKYALFIFSGGSPTNPWDLSNPRSNFFSGGSLTPFGKAYAAWDGDKTIHDDTPYVLHNRNARHRIRNDGADEPSPSWIRREDASVQWVLEDAGDGKRYITSVVDNRRLSYDGQTLEYAPAGSTGSAVEWTINREQYGWHNLIHTSSGEYLRLVRQNDANNAPTSMNFEMVSAAAASGYSSTDWWFVQPYNAVQPENLSPTIDSVVYQPGDTPSFDLTFSKAVDPLSLDTADFSFENLSSGQTWTGGSLSLTNVTPLSATVQFLDAPMPAGYWRLTTPEAAYTDGAGNPSDAFTHDFEVLLGDANGDALVDIVDYAHWRQAFGGPATSAANFNRDTAVSAADFALWRDNLVASSTPQLALAPAADGADDVPAVAASSEAVEGDAEDPSALAFGVAVQSPSTVSAIVVAPSTRESEEDRQRDLAFLLLAEADAARTEASDLSLQGLEPASSDGSLDVDEDAFATLGAEEPLLPDDAS